MKLIATQEFTYADVPLKVGDKFDASDEDARILKGAGKARDHAPPEKAAATETKVMDTKSSGATLFEQTRKPVRGGRYNRSDMRAKD